MKYPSNRAISTTSNGKYLIEITHENQTQCFPGYHTYNEAEHAMLHLFFLITGKCYGPESIDWPWAKLSLDWKRDKAEKGEGDGREDNAEF